MAFVWRILIAVMFFILWALIFTVVVGPILMVLSQAASPIPPAAQILAILAHLFLPPVGILLALVLAILNFAVGWPWTYRRV